jgi:hypothetical protein
MAPKRWGYYGILSWTGMESQWILDRTDVAQIKRPKLSRPYQIWLIHVDTRSTRYQILTRLNRKRSIPGCEPMRGENSPIKHMDVCFKKKRDEWIYVWWVMISNQWLPESQLMTECQLTTECQLMTESEKKPAILLSSFRIFKISKYFESIVCVQVSNKSRKSGGALRPKSGSSGALFSPIRGSHESM